MNQDGYELEMTCIVWDSYCRRLCFVNSPVLFEPFFAAFEAVAYRFAISNIELAVLQQGSGSVCEHSASELFRVRANIVMESEFSEE